MTAAQAKRIAALEAEAERLYQLVERAKLLLPGWPPEDNDGGGREETPGGGTSPSGVSPSPPREMENGHDGLRPKRTRRTAARKEAK